MANLRKDKNRKKGKKDTVIEKIAAELELPSDMLPGSFHIEMSGNTEAVVDGCKGVLEYKDEKIKLNLNKKTITFYGMQLELKAYTLERAVVSGLIVSVEFSD